MASSSFPFYSSPSAYPSAAAYPPPLSTGGYHPSPLPFATYPYPPPASAYTTTFTAPTAGFSPNWPKPAPYPTPSTAPSTTKDGRTVPRDSGVIQTEKSSTAAHPAKPVTCQDGDLTKGSNTSGASIYGVHKLVLLQHPTTEMFGEMPTSGSGYDYCPGHHNISLNTCVLDRNGNLSEQHIDRMPQAYGFHNLNCKSVVPEPMFAVYDESDSSSTESVPLFTGTEHSCSLGPVFDTYDDDMDGCSTEFFDVFVGTPEKKKSDQFANCFCEALNAFHEDTPEQVSHAYDVDTKGKAPENGQTIASLNYISDIFDFTIELQQQNDERAGNCSVLKASNSFVSKSSQLNIEHSMRERRLLWDPGAAAYLMTPLNDGSSNAPVGNEHVGQLVSSTGDCFSHGTTKLWSEYRQQYIVLPGASASLDSNKSKPPEELSYVAMFVPKVLTLCIQAGSYEQQLRDSSCSMLITHDSRKEWDPGDNTILSSALNRDIVVLQTSTLTTSGIFTLPFVLTVRVQFGVPTCVPQQSCFGRVLYSQQNFGIQFLWDPGILRWRTISAQHILESGSIFSTECMLPWNPSYSILLLHHFLLEFSMDRVLSKSAVLNLMNLKHFWALLSLQFYSWCTILDAFLRLQYYCLPIVFDCLCPEPVQQLVCYYSLFRSTAMSMSTATTVHMRLVLGSGKIAQEEKDVAAIYQVLKIQLLMRKTAHIWDPGIEPILLLYKELHVHKIQQVHCSAIHACYFCVFAMLPPTQMLYAYTVGFLNGQGEFLDQQGVQRNYSAKHLLLFSDNYLQIWELDIIFITFLPP